MEWASVLGFDSAWVYVYGRHGPGLLLAQAAATGNSLGRFLQESVEAKGIVVFFGCARLFGPARWPLLCIVGCPDTTLLHEPGRIPDFRIVHDVAYGVHY